MAVRMASCRPLLIALTACVAACKTTTSAPASEARASSQPARTPAAQPVPACPVQQNHDEIFVDHLDNPMATLFVEGPWLYGVSGECVSNHVLIDPPGAIVRIDRATGRTTRLLEGRGLFRSVMFAPSYIYWSEEAQDKSLAMFRLERPGGQAEQIAGSPSCFLIGTNAYYTYLEQSSEPDAGVGKAPLRGLFRVTHRGKNAKLIHASDGVRSCAWAFATPETVVIDEASGRSRTVLDTKSGPEQDAEEMRRWNYPSLTSDAGVVTLAITNALGGARHARIAFDGHVKATLVEGDMAYVAMKPETPPPPQATWPLWLFKVTLDGKTPAEDLGYARDFVGGLAADECFLYYSSGNNGGSIRRIPRQAQAPEEDTLPGVLGRLRRDDARRTRDGGDGVGETR